MRANPAVWLFVVGACSTSSLNDGVAEQAVADPAPTMSITAATFHTAIGGTSIAYCGQAGSALCLTSPHTQARWGSPANTVDQSGLGFEAAAPHVVVYEDSFAIGSLTHFNFPTYAGTGASGISLDLQVRVDPSGAGLPIFDQAITIPFTIDETPNAEPCTYTSLAPCADKITFGTSTFQLASTLDDTVYDLNIIGFVDPASPTPIDGLISEESGTSSAVLLAVLREHCVDEDEDGACDCPVEEPSCMVSQLCPCDGPWKNHGKYVSCVAHETTRLVGEGLLTHTERAELVSTAGQSSCGQ